MAPMKKQHLETDLENVHSLPNIEEAHTHSIMASGGAINNKYSGKKKRAIALIVVLVAVIAASIGFTISATNSKRSQNESNSLANNGDGDVDSDTGADGEGGDDDGTELSDDNENDDTERIDQVKMFLSSNDMSSESSLADSSSPQYKAASWIANMDVRELDIPEAYDEDDAYKFIQRYVMAVFYFALGGENWIRQSNFISNDATCNWSFELTLKKPVRGTDQQEFDYGVSCFDNEMDEYDDTVTFIFMPDNNLVGSLPSEIGLLTNLNHISLFSNKISGVLPESIRELKNLNYLAMESNQLSGPLPTWINEFESLEYLALGNNSFSGPLPSFDGSPLEQLSLDMNQLTGSIDSLNDATKLEVAYLNDNQFTGQLTENTWNDLGNIGIADLSNNRLEGSFPVTFYWFEEIDLSNNELTGIITEPMPDDDADDDDEFPIEKLNLSGNQMKGSIPTSIDKLSFLVSFDVSSNALTGTIPTQFGALIQLESLYLSYNRFDVGAIPDLRDCQSLTEISMASTNRNSVIGEWIGTSLSKLELLDLHSNKITGTIPINLSELDNLNVLMLNDNSLNGNLPSELGELAELETLFLDHNLLTGDMRPICDGNSDDLVNLSVDTTVVNCGDSNRCCSDYCETNDDSCNKPIQSNLTKSDLYVISRDMHIFDEEFVLAPVPSPDN